MWVSHSARLTPTTHGDIMIEATERTTKTPTAPPQPVGPFADVPSLAELGRISLSLHDRKHEQDCLMLAAADDSREYLDAKLRFNRLEATAFAVDDMAITLPVRTLADAAAWAVFGYGEIEGLALGAAAEEAGLSDRLKVVMRGLAGVALVLVKATGQSPDTLMCAETEALLRKYAAAEGVSGADQELMQEAAEVRCIEAELSRSEFTDEAARDALHERQSDAMRRLAAQPAHAAAGLRAKAAALVLYCADDMPEDGTPCGAVIASMLADLTGVGGPA